MHKLCRREPPLALRRACNQSDQDNAGAAMNCGPTGSVTSARRTRSILALAEASSDQPDISSTGCDRAGWRAPRSAAVIPDRASTGPPDGWPA